MELFIKHLGMLVPIGRFSDDGRLSLKIDGIELDGAVELTAPIFIRPDFARDEPAGELVDTAITLRAVIPTGESK